MRNRLLLLALSLIFLTAGCHRRTGGSGGSSPREIGTDTTDTATPDRDTASDTSPFDSGVDTSVDVDTGPMDVPPSDTRSDGTIDADAGIPTLSIRELRSRVSLSPGDSTSDEYRITDVIVTGIEADGAGVGFYVQDVDPPPEESGLWIFTANHKLSGSLPPVDVADVLEIQGTVTNYDNMGNSTMGGLLEIEAVSDLKVLRTNPSLPSPVRVSASDVALSGPDSETYEGVLIEVTMVEVAAAPNMFKDTELTSGLFIGPTLYDYTVDYSPSAGTTYSSIIGPLHFSHDHTEIVPRMSGDITP